MLINEKQEALEYLEIASKYHYEELPMMLFRPDFKTLHNEPRFKALVKKTGIVLNTSFPIKQNVYNFKD